MAEAQIKKALNGGKLSGIIIAGCILIDVVAGSVFGLSVLKIPTPIGMEWLSWMAVAAGIAALFAGSVVGYLSHEVFHKAASADGAVKFLMQDGVYASVRHPFYASLMMISLGLALLFQSLVLFLGFLIVVFILVRESRIEEKILENTFGGEYFRYRQKSGMFFPKLLRLK
ncbi:MAG: isoprenylcysteine carboxylmethyltransferase family protein [Anaerolineales bacterium]|nr:isoprenylcysteine carboxylmethyltransferase family protein [Anaerolineales bacterium]